MTFDVSAMNKKLREKIVGREKELVVILSAIQARLPLLLVGTPGVSKTTILHAISEELHPGQAIFQVTGDEQLNAYTLAGSFDPGLVIKDGYKKEYFTFGPLAQAMMSGGILYIEELNRAPSGALNVLMTALSDEYLEIPRYGRITAVVGFTIIGSSNPMDDVGTQRLSRGLADRFVTVEMGVQTEAEEIEVVRRKHPLWSQDWLEFAVYMARASRTHPDLRHGASIRGPIAFLELLSHWESPSEETVYACGVAAFLSKIKVKASSDRTGSDIVREIMQRKFSGETPRQLFDQWKHGQKSENKDSSGGALVEADGGADPALHKGGAVRESSGLSPPTQEGEEQGLGAGGIRGSSKMKPGKSPFLDLTETSMSVVHSMNLYSDKPWIPIKEIERWIELSATRIVEGSADESFGKGRQLASCPWESAPFGEIDLEQTLNHLVFANPNRMAQDIYVYYRQPIKKDFIVFIDHSGSMVGKKLMFSAALAGTLAHLGAMERGRYGVYAFDQEVTEIKRLEEDRMVREIIEDILYLPEGRSTDLSQALRYAVRLLDDAEDVEVIFVSDCMPTRGDKTFAAMNRWVQRIPKLFICYMNNTIGADFTVETLTGQNRVDLYGLWAIRWVGPERFFIINELYDLPLAMRLLLGERGGVLV